MIESEMACSAAISGLSSLHGRRFALAVSANAGTDVVKGLEIGERLELQPIGMDLLKEICGLWRRYHLYRGA